MTDNKNHTEQTFVYINENAILEIDVPEKLKDLASRCRFGAKKCDEEDINHISKLIKKYSNSKTREPATERQIKYVKSICNGLDIEIPYGISTDIAEASNFIRIFAPLFNSNKAKDKILDFSIRYIVRRYIEEAKEYEKKVKAFVLSSKDMKLVDICNEINIKSTNTVKKYISEIDKILEDKDSKEFYLIHLINDMTNSDESTSHFINEQVKYIFDEKIYTRPWFAQ